MQLPQHGAHDGEPPAQDGPRHDRTPQDMHGEGAPLSGGQGLGEAALRVVVAREEFDVVASLLQGEGGIDDEALGSSCGRVNDGGREESGRCVCGEEEMGESVRSPRARAGAAHHACVD